MGKSSKMSRFEMLQMIAELQRMRKDERGGITILTLLLLIVMLIIGGMAVDFMRFESERAKLQSVSDRAVLAAADLDQASSDPNMTVAMEEARAKGIVTDFFAKAGYANAIIGEVDAVATPGNRSLTVESEIDLDTFYLRLIGIDNLDAPAYAQAKEGTGNVEVSLVLDISGSMGTWVESEQATRLDLLKDAAKTFVGTLLKDEYKDQISINLVTYSQNVNAGTGLFDAMTTTPRTTLPSGIGQDTVAHVNTGNCIDFLPTHFDQLALDPEHTHNQVEQAAMNGANSPVCSENEGEAIIALSQNKGFLQDVIEDLEPTNTTAIHMGMKWGTLLLDPSMRTVLNSVSESDPRREPDPAFSGLRPSEYNNNSNTTKYIILMTDGFNVPTNRVRPEVFPTALERVGMSNLDPDYGPTTFVSWAIAQGYTNWNQLRYQPHSTANQDDWLLDTCNRAKDKYKVFTISQAPSTGVEVDLGAEVTDADPIMVRCASSRATAFQTTFSSDDGAGIDDIFEDIAAQITALRLGQ